jgi:hypothetical protein
MGHLVIRLSSYHCKYSPLQLIWTKVKEDVAQLSNTFRLSHIDRLMNEATNRH